jgi:hypothetical protein
MKNKTKSPEMTPFELAILSVSAGETKVPSVNFAGKDVNYFLYQLATSKMAISLLSKGIKMTRHAPPLKYYKQYYGFKGKTASDCLVEIEALIAKLTTIKEEEKCN